MKIKIDVTQIVAEGYSTKELIASYHKNYKKDGYVLDGEMIYKIHKRKIELNEGDRISLEGFGICIIDWKCYDMENNTMEYSVVHE